MDKFTIEKSEASKINQIKQYGVMSIGGDTLWGEGDSETEAIRDARTYLTDNAECYGIDVNKKINFNNGFMITVLLYGFLIN